MKIDAHERCFSNRSPLYSHEYEGYIDFFKYLATTTQKMAVYNAPCTWAPLIVWLGHDVKNLAMTWPTCHAYWIEALDACDTDGQTRLVVESACAARPELVHALYLCDNEWPCPLAPCTADREFYVTNNSSFFRSEVHAFRKRIQEYIVPSSREAAVIVPCAADKPYPSELHRSIDHMLTRLNMRASWHMIIATGVFGLIPEELWHECPLYDSGMPNQWRCMKTTEWYFSVNNYKRVVVYSDFYAHPFSVGIERSRLHPPRVDYVFGKHERDMYSNLMLQEHLYELERTLVWHP